MKKVTKKVVPKAKPVKKAPVKPTVKKQAPVKKTTPKKTVKTLAKKQLTPAKKAVKKVTKPVPAKKPLKKQAPAKVVKQRTKTPLKAAPVKAVKKAESKKIIVPEKSIKTTKIGIKAEPKKMAVPVKPVKTIQKIEVKNKTMQKDPVMKEPKNVNESISKKATNVTKSQKTEETTKNVTKPAPATRPYSATGTKRRLVVSFKNLSPELMAELKEKYPHGYIDYMDEIMKVTKPDGTYFHAITLDLPDTVYLVKVDVKVDDYDEVEKVIFGGGGDSGDPDFPETDTDTDDENNPAFAAEEDDDE